MNIVVQLYLSLRVSSQKKNTYLWECQTANVWITTTKAQLWYFEDLGRQRFDISAPFFFSIRSDHSDISNFVSFAFSSPELLFAKNWNTKAFQKPSKAPTPIILVWERSQYLGLSDPFTFFIIVLLCCSKILLVYVLFYR